MYRSNKIRAKKAFIFIEKCMQSAYLQWCRPKRSDRNARALFAKMFDPLDFTPEQTLYCSDELFLKFGMRSVEL